MFKIALCQMDVTRKIPENHEALKRYMEDAAKQGADFFVPPEMWSCSFNPKTFREDCEDKDGPSYTLMQEGAKEYGFYVVGGSIPIRNGERVNNSCFVFDRQGNEIANYNKIHMFDLVTETGVDIRESANIAPGEATVTFDTEFGKCGVAICYDLRFPGQFLKMAKEGARLFFLPAAFMNETGKKHWLTLSKARALDTQCFFAAVGVAYREEAKAPCFGHSCIFDPWGDPVVEMDEKPGLTVAEIDLDLVDKYRAKLPVLQHQRPDIY